MHLSLALISEVVPVKSSWSPGALVSPRIRGLFCVVAVIVVFKTHLGDTVTTVRNNTYEGVCTVSHFGWFSKKDPVWFFFCLDATAEMNIELGVYQANTSL